MPLWPLGGHVRLDERFTDLKRSVFLKSPCAVLLCSEHRTTNTTQLPPNLQSTPLDKSNYSHQVESAHNGPEVLTLQDGSPPLHGQRCLPDDESSVQDVSAFCIGVSVLIPTPNP